MVNDIQSELLREGHSQMPQGGAENGEMRLRQWM